jgi:hypothetical protein
MPTPRRAIRFVPPWSRKVAKRGQYRSGVRPLSKKGVNER